MGPSSAKTGRCCRGMVTAIEPLGWQVVGLIPSEMYVRVCLCSCARYEVCTWTLLEEHRKIDRSGLPLSLWVTSNVLYSGSWGW